MVVTITLTNIGPNAGPFELYSDVDSFGTPFETVSLQDMQSSYTTALAPDNSTIIRVVSIESEGNACTFTRDFNINFITTTSTTTAGPTTSTTTTLEPTTSTTTTVVQTTTTTTTEEITTSTTTTIAPTTSTTTTTALDCALDGTAVENTLTANVR